MKTKALTILILCLAGLLLHKGSVVTHADGPTIINIGPPGGAIRVLVADPKTASKLYAVTNSGIYITLDQGSSWSLVNPSTPANIVLSIGSISIDPVNTDTMYAAASFSGLYKSVDGAKTWTTVNTGVPSNTAISSVAVDPFNPNNIYVGTQGQSIYRSTDSGNSWSRIPGSALNGKSISTFAFGPNLAGTIFAGANNGVWVSGDGGNTWQLTDGGIPSGRSINAIVLDKIITTRRYAATSFGIYRITNAGGGWLPINNGIPSSDYVSTLVMDPTDHLTLYAGTFGNGGLPSGRVYKTTDGGDTWNPAIGGLSSLTAGILLTNPLDPSVIFAGTAGGVFKSTNKALTWTGQNSGLNSGRISTLAIDQTNSDVIYAGLFGGGLYKSTDAGQNWISVSEGIGGTTINALRIDPINSSTIYAATNTSAAKSLDGGLTWTVMNTGFPGAGFSCVAIDPFNSLNVVLGFPFGGVLKTTDGGATWNPVNNGFFQDSLPNVTSMAFDPHVQNTVYVATNQNGLYKSTDGAASWVHLTSVHPESSVGQVLVDSRTANTVYVLSCGLLKSTDGAASFTPVNNQPLCSGTGLPPGMSQVLLDPIQTNVIYAAANDGVYRTSDGGIHWGKFAPTSNIVTALAIPAAASTPIYAGTFDAGAIKIIPASDTVPPSASIADPVSGSIFASRTIFVSGSASDDPLGSGLAFVTVNGSTATFDAATDLFTATVTAPGDGPFTITVTATDKVGNVSSAVTSSVVIDTIAPSIAITSPNTGDTINGAITVTGTVSDSGTGIAAVAVNHVQATITGNTFTAVINNACNSGAVTLTATASDKAGNSATVNRQVNITGSTATAACVDSVGPFRGDIQSVVIDPQNSNVLYAASAKGQVYKSTNAGLSWQNSSTGLTGPGFSGPHVLAIDPSNSQVIYFGSAGHSIYKSTDGGASWISPTFGFSGNVNAISINKNTGSIFAATAGGLYRSTDGGAHWSVLNNGISSNASFSSVAVDPNSPSTIYTTPGALSKSTDDGQTWAFVGGQLNSQSVVTVAVDPTASNVIYAANSLLQLFVSTNSGTSFSQLAGVTIPNAIVTIVVDPLHPSTVFIASDGSGLFKSTQQGANPIQTNTNLQSLFIRSIAIDKNNSSTIYLATKAGIAKSIDGGATWNDASSGVSSVNVRSFARPSADSNVIFAATDQGVARSTDNGSTWGLLNSNLSSVDVYGVDVSASNPQTLYAATFDGMFKSIDGGSLWTPINNGLELKLSNGVLVAIPQAVLVDPVDQNIAYIALNGTNSQPSRGAYKTVNGGLSWTPINNGLPANSIFTLLFDPNSSSTVLAGTASGLFRTTNGGGSWTRLSPQNDSSPVTSVASVASQPGTIYYAVNGPSVRKSVDNGLTWKTLTTGLSNTQVWSVTVDANNPNVVYAGTVAKSFGPLSQIFLSNNGGTNWNLIANNVSGTAQINALLQDAAFPKTVYAATIDSGISIVQLPADTTAPTVSITAPAANSFSNAQSILVTGTATDTLSGVASVSINGQSASFDLSANAFSSVIPAGPEGTLTISVTATDNAGNTNTPVTRTVTIDRTPPVLTIDSPAEGGSVGSSIVVTGTVNDSGAGVASVFINGFRATISGNSYSVTLSNQCNRPLSITATAFD